MSKIIEFRSKLNSVKKINKMTESMQIVAAAQLKQIQGRQRSALHFRQHYDRMAKRLKINIKPQTKTIEPVIMVYVFTSERGFCGGFNERLLSSVLRFAKEQEAAGKSIRIVVVGGKGCEIFRERFSEDVCKWIKSSSKLGFNEVAENADEAYDFYLGGHVEKVCLFYNEFKSMLAQEPVLKQVLPFDFSKTATPPSGFVLAEPSEAVVARYSAANYVKVLFYDAFMQSSLGEVASRLLTMRSACENSKEIINGLSIQLNKARQSMITYELSEIISSFEILTEGA